MRFATQRQREHERVAREARVAADRERARSALDMEVTALVEHDVRHTLDDVDPWRMLEAHAAPIPDVDVDVRLVDDRDDDVGALALGEMPRPRGQRGISRAVIEVRSPVPFLA